jgi:Cys-tRNA(Pro) deacylase
VCTPALEAAEAVGLSHRVIRHGPASSLGEAARARGVVPADVVKTLVVRRGEDDFLFVLVPVDRAISWPKLRRLLGVSRLSMPDAEVARQATGYERGTITPFGSARPWPVIADERVRGRTITLGAGEHGLALAAEADAIVRALDASVADISDPSPLAKPSRPPRRRAPVSRGRRQPALSRPGAELHVSLPKHTLTVGGRRRQHSRGHRYLLDSIPNTAAVPRDIPSPDLDASARPPANAAPWQR